MIYHFAKKHSRASPRAVHKCRVCDEDFHSFYLLREYKRKEHGAQRGPGAHMLMLHN